MVIYADLCILNFAYVSKNQEKMRNISFLKLDVKSFNSEKYTNNKINTPKNKIWGLPVALSGQALNVL